MKKINKIKEDIDSGLPTAGKLIGEMASDLPKNIRGLISLNIIFQQ